MEGFNERQYPKHEKGDEAECLWCGATITDGTEVSGWTGEGPDWMDNGDFGCSDSPLSSEEGTGGHQTREDVAREVWELNERRGAEYYARESADEHRKRLANVDAERVETVEESTRSLMARYGYR